MSGLVGRHGGRLVKSEWIVLLAAFLYVALLAFAAGAFSYSLSPATEPMPFGAVEFWLNRYQTLAVSVFAILGLVGVWLQLGTMRKQTSAALQQAHKAEFSAFSLSRSAVSRLLRHVETAEELRKRHGLAVAISDPPELDEEVVKQLRNALSTTVPDPFGIADIYDVWKTCCDDVRSGRMPINDFLIVGYQTKAQLENIDNSLQQAIEILHAQIEASV